MLASHAKSEVRSKSPVFVCLASDQASGKSSNTVEVRHCLFYPGHSQNKQAHLLGQFLLSEKPDHGSKAALQS